MMATSKIKLSSLLILWSLFLMAQKNELGPKSEFAGHTYDVSSLTSSPDKQYITFEKTYQYNTDTVALVKTNNPDRIIAQWSPVFAGTLRYTPQGNLFISGANTAQLVRFPSLQRVIWKNITQAFYLENYSSIIIYSSETLQIYNGQGKLEDEIKNTTAVMNLNGKLLYKIRAGEREILMQWSPQETKVVYDTQNTDVTVDFFEENILIVHETDKDTHTADLIYIDTQLQSSPRQIKTLKYPSLKLQAISNLGASGFLLKTIKQISPAQKSTVDIWYANDRFLEKKFQNNSIFQYIIWDPKHNTVTELDAAQFPNHVFVGNKRFLLAYNPTENQDYIRKKIQYNIYRYDTALRRYECLGKTGIAVYTDKKGKFILSHDNRTWILYNMNTLQKQNIALEPGAKPYFDLVGETILFVGNGRITSYHIKNNALTSTAIPLAGEPTVFNTISRSVNNEQGFNQNVFDAAKPLLLKITESSNAKEALGAYLSKSFRWLIHPLDQHLSAVTPIQKEDSFFYVKSAYNLPPIIMQHQDDSENSIFHTNAADSIVKGYRQEKVRYQNTKSSALVGLLYYPADFDPSKKYPMIVGIYELMRYQTNRYLKDGFSGVVEGFNIRYFLDKGYFVYLPDIGYDGRGPGRSALDCVESALDAIAGRSVIDFTKVGLIGHSHGGYETNFIATQSTRFAAYVAGAGNSDLVRSFHSYNYNFKSPFYWQFEEGQYRIFKPFAADKKIYIDNSPVYHAENVTAPVLLWAGTKDENIAWDQTMEFYLGLRRNNKKVVALFYKGESHSFSNKTNREDLFLKIADWFDYFLKDQKTEWVTQIFK